MKKIGALVLALMLVMSLMSTAFAAPDGDLSGGLDGEFTNDAWAADASETVNIQKELVSDNADDSTVNAPTISYTYYVTAGSAGETITDATGAHASGVSVTVTTKAGVTTGLKVNNATGTSGTIAWTPAESLTEGSHIKNLVLDFSDVVFGAAGVYRYVITEKPEDATATADITAAYLAAGVTETTGTHVRYLDVYVKPAASSFTDGSAASDWDVYGYACFTNNNDIDATDTSSSEPDVAAAVKTNGFVSGTSVDPDIYYTFNVTISKTVAGDTLLMTTHAQFPFTVTFANTNVTANVLPIVSTSANYASGGTALTAGNINSITAHNPTIGHGGSVTYTGIPSGTVVSVYETITATGTTGVTYAVTTTGADTNLNQVVANPNSSTAAVYAAQTVQAANTSTTIAFTNTLQLISPTGYVVRIAPYALILMFGIGLIVLLAVRRRKEQEEA